MVLRVEGLQFRGYGLRVRVSGLGFGVKGFGFRIQSFWFQGVVVKFRVLTLGVGLNRFRLAALRII